MREAPKAFLFGGYMKKLTQDYLMQILTYDAESGLFYWNKETSKRLIKESVAGTEHEGYIRIGIDKKLYRAHRLAWLYIYGKFPDSQIDHINGIKTDNKIQNLRLATNSQNCSNREKQSNNTSGYKGVCFIKSKEKWRARIGYSGKKIDIGFFDTAKEASYAYKEKAIELHGEFAKF